MTEQPKQEFFDELRDFTSMKLSSTHNIEIKLEKIFKVLCIDAALNKCSNLQLKKKELIEISQGSSQFIKLLEPIEDALISQAKHIDELQIDIENLIKKES